MFFPEHGDVRRMTRSVAFLIDEPRRGESVSRMRMSPKLLRGSSSRHDEVDDLER